MTFFFYGSLKTGLYNNVLLQQDGCLFIGRDNTKREFQLWSLGPYPAMSTGNQSVPGEIWDITNDEVIEIIEQMKKGAGYYQTKIKTESDIEAWAFLMTETKAQRVGTPVTEWPPKIKDQSTLPAYHERRRADALSSLSSVEP